MSDLLSNRQAPGGFAIRPPGRPMFAKIAAIASIAASSLALAIMMIAAVSRARNGGRTKAFAGLCASALVYSLGYLLELLAPDLDSALRVLRFEYIGIATIAPFLTLVAYEFLEEETPRLPPLLLFALPAAVLVLVWTMRFHRLYYLDPSVRDMSGLSVLEFGRGPAYWLHILYQNLLIAYCVFVFSRHSIRGPRAKRVLARFMLTGCLLPWTGFVLYVAGRIPLSLDPTPVTLAFTGALFAVGFFRYRMFDLRPVARDTVFEQMRDAVLVTDDQGAIVDHNTAARKLFPALAGFPGFRTARDLAPNSPSFVQAMARTYVDAVVALDQAEGERRYALHHSVLTDRAGRILGTAHVFMDITERLHMEERLTVLASTDELTGVANRRHFFERARAELERAQRYGRPFGVAILDLDDFKAINDNFGHPAGDEALRLASRLCAETLRNADIMGRYGGDEFAFAFPECDEDQAREAADRLSRILASSALPYGDAIIRLSASVGYAGASSPPLPDLDSLLKLADERMYDKKGRPSEFKSVARDPDRD